jgi:hypothetical protein
MTEETINLNGKEYRPPFTVQIQYFKLSGKFYSEGAYQTEKLQMYEIFLEVRAMLHNGKRPGLVDSQHNEFTAYVTVPDHPHNHPHLITLA